jgi:DNA invertase Pin-like site-specific DNA recombinase
MRIGYTRAATQEQDLTLQHDMLIKAKCEKIFMEKVSGVQLDRPQLTAALELIREGDTLIVCKLDRLARSHRQLIETVEMLENGVLASGQLPKPSIRPAPIAN